MTPSQTRSSLYPGMYEEHPVTLLVMPPINNTANVEAKELLYTSISRPLAEAGYYVIPPTLAMAVLRQESGYDAELFLDRPLRQFHRQAMALGLVVVAIMVCFSILLIYSRRRVVRHSIKIMEETIERRTDELMRSEKK